MLINDSLQIVTAIPRLIVHSCFPCLLKSVPFWLPIIAGLPNGRIGKHVQNAQSDTPSQAEQKTAKEEQVSSPACPHCPATEVHSTENSFYIEEDYFSRTNLTRVNGTSYGIAVYQACEFEQRVSERSQALSGCASDGKRFERVLDRYLDELPRLPLLICSAPLAELVRVLSSMIKT
jgi:hypothetical protein